ncbi:MAG TPA: PAS domain S-box protein [Bryobacteraceae bacterium]
MSFAEELHRRLIEAVPEGIWVVDPQGLTIFSNPRMAEILGTDFESMSGRSCFECVFPEELEDAQRQFARCLAGDRRPFDFRLRRADGSPIWVSISCMPVHDDAGVPVGLLGLFSDITERKQAEAALRESEERFRSLADAAAVMIWSSGLDKVCTFFNKRRLDFTGRSMEQELADGWASGVHPEDLDRCQATYNSSFDARIPFQTEYRLRRADGTYRWVLDQGTPRYRDREFVGFIGSAVDITEHKRIQERLRANEARLLAAQRLANVGSWERHLESHASVWSEEMFHILGIKPDEPPSFPLFMSRVHPEDQEKVSVAARDILSGTVPGEYRIVRPDGQVRFVRTVSEVVRNNSGEPIRIVGATQDITERRQAEAGLRESEQRFRRVFEEGPLGLALVGRDYRFLTVNSALCQMVGYTEEELTQKSFADITHPDDLRVDVELAERLFRREIPFYRMQKRYVKKNGEVIWINLTASLLLNGDGEPLHGLAMVEDITEIKRAQDEALARQKLESVGTLARGIAHDFNNLLGAVLAQAELALGDLAAGSRPIEEVKAIRDVAMRGSEIVRELMIYAGEESPADELVDLSRIVKEMLELLKVSVSKHAVIETDLGHDLPSVRASAAQLRQVVMNLVTNASEALGDRDGLIRVTTSFVTGGKESSEAVFDFVVDGAYLQFEVSDTGCGMPPEVQAKVFDPFFTTKTAGRGLGLAVVQGVVRGLQGAIHLHSEPGKGSTFRILLPCAETAPEKIRGARDGAEEPEGPIKGVTVLIVEDEALLREPVAAMLRKKGFEVLEAADGFSAIDLLRANGGKIDAMLLDMTIPGASSPEVVMAAAKAWPDIKVILTSAYSKEIIAERMSASQVHSFIRKPFVLGDLLQTFREALPSHRKVGMQAS